MAGLFRRLRSGERGQAIVETALVLPIIILLLLTMVDGGRVFHTWIVVTNGAREGARAAVLRNAELTVLDKVDQAMPTIGTFDLQITDGYEDPAVLFSGDPVTVDVSTDVELVTPLIGNLFGGSPFTVTASATMQLE